MKRLFTLLLISFAALSCEMVDEKLDEILGKKDIVVFAEGTELTANVPSKQTVLNYKFESTLDWEVKTDAEWLEIDPTSGKAGKDIKIQVKVAKNKSEHSRTGYADLTLSNNDSYRITINQAGENNENNNEGNENDDTVVDIPNNQIWYTSTDDQIVEPYSDEDGIQDNYTTFGANIISNTYENGQGIITFDGDVTEIGTSAFCRCDILTSVTIPNSVTIIGEGAFACCYELTSATIGDSVTAIGYAAFAECDSLTNVNIPNSVTKIGESAFHECHSLTSVTIPDGVTVIEMGAFFWCTNITSVTIGNSVTTIEMGAFSGCHNLQEFNGKFASEDGRCLIIDGVLNSFAIGCSATKYTIPDGVTTIGGCAFYESSSLTSVTIPDSVTEIGDAAFSGCSSLTSVTIPDSITTIGRSVFSGCSSLTSVTIPNSVTEIGRSVFSGCSSLTSVTIPDSITTIGGLAFYECSSLTSVTIPDSVTTIGWHAFKDCSNLASVYCKATTPPVALISYGDWEAFDFNALGRKIYVPMESVEAYKSAQGWSDYADDIIGYDF